MRCERSQTAGRAYPCKACQPCLVRRNGHSAQHLVAATDSSFDTNAAAGTARFGTWRLVPRQRVLALEAYMPKITNAARRDRYQCLRLRHHGPAGASRNVLRLASSGEIAPIIGHALFITANKRDFRRSNLHFLSVRIENAGEFLQRRMR